jgi:hypothetical protein
MADGSPKNVAARYFRVSTILLDLPCRAATGDNVHVRDACVEQLICPRLRARDLHRGVCQRESAAGSLCIVIP